MALKIFISLFVLFLGFYNRFYIEDLFAKLQVSYQIKFQLSKLSSVTNYGFLNVTNDTLTQLKNLYNFDKSNYITLNAYANQLIYMGYLDEGIHLIENFILTEIFKNMIYEHQYEIYITIIGAYFKRSEITHCVNSFVSSSCIIPLDKKALHVNKEDMDKVIYYLSFLDPNDPVVIWLTGLAKHLLGENQQSKIDYFQSSKSPVFSNKAHELGVAKNGLAGPVIIDDFNNDHLLDIFISSIDLKDSTRMYYGQHDGTFVDVTKLVNLDGLHGGLNAVQVDVNNDGFLDIFIMRGGWMWESGQISNSLLINKNGKFYDLTRSYGFHSKYPSQVSVWADVNLDGCIDAFVGNEKYYSELYINDCHGGFENMAEEYGILFREFVKGASWGDINNDGLPDLLVSIYGSENKLFLNKGPGQKMQLLKESGIESFISMFPVWFFDFNNDGFEDIYMGYFQPVIPFFSNRILGDNSEMGGQVLINQKNLTFKPIKGSVESFNTMGANFGDVNSDGYIDYLVGTGSPHFTSLVPSEFYINVSGNSRENVTVDYGLGHLQKGHGISFADIDYDGDLDIYLVNGGWYPVDTFSNSLFINSLPSNQWINLKLVGVESNRSAIGARIKLLSEDSYGNQHSFFRTIGSGSSFGANPFEELIAFSDYKLISVQIKWPSGKIATFSSLESKKRYVIYENDNVELIDLKLEK